MDIQLLRQQINLQRRQLTTKQLHTHAKKITELLIQQQCYQQSLQIACYLPYQGEVDTNNIIQQIGHDKKQCYLPALHEKQGYMDFFCYQAKSKLITNRYGIEEPDRNTAVLMPPQKLDMVLVPLIAFDHQGTRLGTGKGYYDRSLQFLLHLSRPTKPLIIGLAYEFQRVERLTRQSWDVPLDAVATEDKFELFD